MKSRTLALLAALALTVACAAPSPAVDTAKPVKIGVAGAHSGDLASYGLPTLKAVQLVVKDINDKGGINGTPVTIIAEDDVCKPEIATNTATKLVTMRDLVHRAKVCLIRRATGWPAPRLTSHSSCQTRAHDELLPCAH